MWSKHLEVHPQDVTHQSNINSYTHKAEVGAELRHVEVEDQACAVQHGEPQVCEPSTEPMKTCTGVGAAGCWRATRARADKSDEGVCVGDHSSTVPEVSQKWRYIFVCSRNSSPQIPSTHNILPGREGKSQFSIRYQPLSLISVE